MQILFSYLICQFQGFHTKRRERKLITKVFQNLFMVATGCRRDGRSNSWFPLGRLRSLNHQSVKIFIHPSQRQQCKHGRYRRWAWDCSWVRRAGSSNWSDHNTVVSEWRDESARDLDVGTANYDATMLALLIPTAITRLFNTNRGLLDTN